MSDPIKHAFDVEGLAVDPLAPAEVRRRGDRMRRRRNVAGTVASVAAVALIATPIALVSSGGEKSSPSPSPPGPTTPTATIPSSGVTTIPAGFPLAAGFPTDSENANPLDGPDQQLDAVELTACGDPVPDAAREDRWVATFTDAEDLRTRFLSTYVDGTAAQSALEAMVTSWQACPAEPVSTDGFVTEREVRPSPLGDDSWAILERDTFEGGESPFGSTLVIVRVGNAVFIENRVGHAGYPAGDGSRLVDEIATSAQPVIAAMCVFTAEGCSEGEGSGTGPSPLTPDDLIVPDETQPRYESGWETVDTIEGEGAEPASPCWTNTFAGRNASAALRRDFVLHGPQGVQGGDRMTAVVAEFPDVQTAQAAFIGFSEDVGLCESRMVPDVTEDYQAITSDEVPLENVDGLARSWFATYGPFPGAPTAVYRIEHGVAWVGKRLVLLTTTAGPFEAGGPPSPTAMETMLVQAAERVIPGPEGPITPVTPLV